MTIIMRTGPESVGTFSWELPRSLEEIFEKLSSKGGTLGWSEEMVKEAQQEIIEYLQDSILPLLHLLAGSIFSGSSFPIHAAIIQGGVQRIAEECLGLGDITGL